MASVNLTAGGLYLKKRIERAPADIVIKTGAVLNYVSQKEG